MDPTLFRFGSVVLVFAAYVVLAFGGLAVVARSQGIAIRRGWVLGRVALNGLAALLPGLGCAAFSLGWDALPALVTLLGAALLLFASLAVTLEAALTIRDHRRVLRGEGLAPALVRMRARARRLGAPRTPDVVDDQTRDVAVDAAVLVMAGRADDARRILAEARAVQPRLPRWVETWSAALDALDALSQAEGAAHAVAALRASDDDDAMALVLVTRALAAGLEGDWARARLELPPRRPSRRASAVLYDLVVAHAAAADSDIAAAERALARIPMRELRERCLLMWRGPASRLGEGAGPYRG